MGLTRLLGEQQIPYIEPVAAGGRRKRVCPFSKTEILGVPELMIRYVGG
jgi:hypothetical protein